VTRGCVLVTGSAVGIGRAIVLALAREGFGVAVHYRTSRDAAEAARAEAESLGVRATLLQADVTDREAATALVEDAHRELGGLRVLVNNVGNYVYTPTSRRRTRRAARPFPCCERPEAGGS
jgi:3-oxoacyl-[acyl-carrier protein] reductase